MEQQDQVQGLTLGHPKMTQSVKPLGEYAQETTELSINDVSAPYEFRDGAYYCEGLDSGYMSLDTLRRAWALKVREEKIKHAQAVAVGKGRASTATPAAKEKARKEYVKWQKTKVE